MPNQSINVVHPNEDNMTVMPITKRMEIITRTQVCLISQMNIDYKENGGKNWFFSQIQSINIVYPNKENIVVVPNHNRNGEYYENPSLSHFTDKL